MLASIGLSYQPARLHRLVRRYDNPMPESTLSPQSGTINLATGIKVRQKSSLLDLKGNSVEI
jgi:hypothetical protein